VGSSARLTFQVGHVDPPQGKVILPEVKEILTEHEASMARKMKENLGVDIRGNTLVYQSHILLILIGLNLLLTLIAQFC
jgi:hypothetical protein